MKIVKVKFIREYHEMIPDHFESEHIEYVVDMIKKKFDYDFLHLSPTDPDCFEINVEIKKSNKNDIEINEI